MTQAILTASSWIQEAIYGFTDLMKSWKINRARKVVAISQVLQTERFMTTELKSQQLTKI